MTRRAPRLALLLLLTCAGRGLAQAPDFSGEWAIEDVDAGFANGVKFTRDDSGRLTGKYFNIEPNEELELRDEVPLLWLTVDEAGQRVTGELELRARARDGALKTVRTSIELAFPRRAGGELEGTYLRKTWRRHADGWEDTGTRAPVRLKPACRPISGGFTVGKGAFAVQVSLAKELHPIRRDEDPEALEGYCHYADMDAASITLRTGDPEGGERGPLAVPLPLEGCAIDFYMKTGGDPRDPTAFQDVKLSWTDDETGALTVFEKWGVRFVVYQVEVAFTVEQDGSLTLTNSYVEVRLDASGERRLSGPIYLAGDLSLTIGYRWDNARAWHQGTWTFDGFAQAELQVRRAGSIPIASLRLRLDSRGEVEAELVLGAVRRWTAFGFEIELDPASISLRARLSLRDGTWALLEGSLAGTIRAPGVPQPFRFELAYREGRFQFRLLSQGTVRLFGGTASDLELAVEFDANTLEFTRIEGRVRWKHDRFDAPLEIRRLVIAGGRLERFEGAGAVKLDGLALTIASLSYDGTVTPPVLRLSASITLARAGAIALRNFTIDGDGRISEFSVEASVNAAPVSISLSAYYSANKLEGTFRGDLGGNIGIAGTVLIGTEREGPGHPEFTYGYLALDVRLGRGIPLGQSGLKLLGLGGAFGFYYAPPGTPAKPAGGPEYDLYYLAGSITIGDLAGFMSLEGKLEVTLGRTTSVTITGTIQVTQGSPYFRGTLSCGYALGSGEVAGSLSSTIKVPASGAVIDTPSNVLTYSVGRGAWRVEGRGLGGELCRALTISEGTVTLGGPLEGDVLRGMRGRLACRVSGGTNKSFSVSLPGASVEAGVRFSVSARLAVDIDANGLSGSIPDLSVHLGGHATVTISDWVPFVGGDTYTQHITASAVVSVTASPGALRFSGTFQVEVSDHSFSLDVDHAF